MLKSYILLPDIVAAKWHQSCKNWCSLTYNNHLLSVTSLTGSVINVRGDKGKWALLHGPLAGDPRGKEGASKGKCTPGGWRTAAIAWRMQGGIHTCTPLKIMAHWWVIFTAAKFSVSSNGPMHFEVSVTGFDKWDYKQKHHTLCRGPQ